jgi:hypothetical protein
MKVCKKCDVKKELNEFHKWSKSKDGLKPYCKLCSSIDRKKYRENNKEKAIKESREYYYNNIDKIREYQNSDVRKAQKKSYYENNKENVIEKSKAYYEDNREYKKERQRQYYKNIKNDPIKNEKRKKKNRERIKKFRRENPHITTSRKILYRVLEKFGKPKSARTIEMLGYSADDLKKHIESLFTEGMSWDNHGEWHIDHIKPISSFDPDTDVSIVNDLDNLQPLWANDNLTKSNKEN